MLRRPHPNRLARNESMRAVADSSTARPYAKQMQEGPSGVLVVAGMLKAWIARHCSSSQWWHRSCWLFRCQRALQLAGELDWQAECSPALKRTNWSEQACISSSVIASTCISTVFNGCSANEDGVCAQEKSQPLTAADLDSVLDQPPHHCTARWPICSHALGQRLYFWRCVPYIADP